MSGLLFIIPGLATTTWSEDNTKLNDLLGPLHHGLSSEVINPKVAGKQVSNIIGDYLPTKHEIA